MVNCTTAKLLIDLGKCSPQQQSGVLCSYNNHPDNHGFDTLLEMIRFALICRRCKEAPCIAACPRNALEKLPPKGDDAGVLSRSKMLCTGCGTCALACPFGTIWPELVLYPSSVCDRCAGRLAQGEKPLCVRTARDGAVDYGLLDGEKDPDMVEVFDGIVVRVRGGQLWEPFLDPRKRSRKWFAGVKK